MAASGWYPDPGGAPGRYRFWDGSRWSDELTDDPHAAPPWSGPGGPGGGPRTRRGAMIIGVLAVLVVVVVVGVLAVRRLSDHHDNVLADPDPPGSTVSAWDDSSPLPTASPTQSATPEPTPSASQRPSADVEPQGQVDCPLGDPVQRAPHPGDGRVHGGAVSFDPPAAGWQHDRRYTYGMTWAYDTDAVTAQVEARWMATMVVGELHVDDGFHRPHQGAEQAMQCVATSGYYHDVSGRKDLSSRAVTINGHAGWAVRSEIRVDDPQVEAAGDVAEIIVVDTGATGTLSFFAGFVPIGDQARIAVLDRTIDGLRVD